MRLTRNHRTGLMIAAVTVAAVAASAVIAQQPAPAPVRGKPPAPGLPPDLPTPGPIVERKRLPDLALQPGQFHKLPQGQRVSELTLPATFGQLRILPVGSVPGPSPAVYEAPPGARPQHNKWGVAIEENQAFAQVDAPGRVVDQATAMARVRAATPPEAQRDLRFPPYIPAGWQLAMASGNVLRWPDGTVESHGSTIGYQRDRFFGIVVVQSDVGDYTVELINLSPDTGQALTVITIAGVPVVVQHQYPGARIQPLMHVDFVQNGVWTRVEAPALDLDELLKITTSIIEAAKER